ncbi:unnamed protein product [Caenorhabditis sp. 36 PRJEB53466]|nr:unnamed protein product [Caenorhabditis sp. 36 PRJEB53466]
MSDPLNAQSAGPSEEEKAKMLEQKISAFQDHKKRRERRNCEQKLKREKEKTEHLRQRNEQLEQKVSELMEGRTPTESVEMPECEVCGEQFCRMVEKTPRMLKMARVRPRNIEEELKTKRTRFYRYEEDRLEAELKAKRLELEVANKRLKVMEEKLEIRMKYMKAAVAREVTRNALLMKQRHEAAFKVTRLFDELEKNRKKKQAAVDHYEAKNEGLKRRVAELKNGTVPPVSLMPDCEICLTEFCKSAENVPRVLGCGHSVCEKCTHDMVEEQETQDTLMCPFCRHVTELTDSDVTSLKKNYTIINMFLRN